MTTSPTPDSTASPVPRSTPDQIEARLEQNRADLAATIDELTERLDPRVRATETVTRAKQVLHDAGTDPSTSTAARDHARKLLGIGALGVAGFVAVVSAIARRR
ncbi:DUF3618 domain-containing protein [Pengzhenrongella frigida]|uniref:DUF3618 domain-containing protein n=1 Tax=Pengzhenrongella frigida TaxID=1259133 RepID=A0A4Q5N2I3_9MICO|nr:DUF3618 domain-containing protein [Cellulomonas sp. HLT2-17]RYV51443.1 DUF3618 domain-containing protein [Cellulomonas sp. HLT2-17]